MATTFTKQVLENGHRNYIALFNIVSDGAEGALQPALDPTSSGDMVVIPSSVSDRNASMAASSPSSSGSLAGGTWLANMSHASSKFSSGICFLRFGR